MRALHVLALALLLPLAACGRSDPPADADRAPAGLSRTSQKAWQLARDNLARRNIGIGGKSGLTVQMGRIEDLPEAEITPQGDLLIEGRPVELDETQRGQLLAYREQLVDLAAEGAALGVEGARLGMKAATGAVMAMLTGNREQYKHRLKAEGSRIEEQAGRLVCARLPDLMARQQALAAAIPEFGPYATLTRADIDDCGKRGGKWQMAVNDDRADGTPQEGGWDPAAEADAAAARVDDAR